MKIIAFIIGVCALAALGEDLTRAVGFSKGAWAKTCFSIVDQDNLPVEEARIYGGFTLGARDKCGLVDGVTDTNGGFIAEGKCNDWLHYSVTKDGYYMAEGDVKYLDTKFVPAVVDGKWQPYGDVRKISLKQIKNPFLVTVFGESRSRRQIPKFGEWIGFDLEDGDWVSPYGRGKHKDVLLRFMADVRKRRVDYTYVMDVSFTNNPYAGAYVMRKDNGSDLKTEYCADTNATYKTEFSFRTKCLPGKRFEDGCLDGGSYLIFRTRTRVDERGLLVGAHYGKINGVWRSTNSEMLISDGCFNPQENDTNIEGDQELLYKLKNYKKLR